MHVGINLLEPIFTRDPGMQSRIAPLALGVFQERHGANATVVVVISAQPVMPSLPLSCSSLHPSSWQEGRAEQLEGHIPKKKRSPYDLR